MSCKSLTGSFNPESYLTFVVLNAPNVNDRFYSFNKSGHTLQPKQ